MVSFRILKVTSQLTYSKADGDFVSQGSVVTHLRMYWDLQQSLTCKFIANAKFIGEIILKIYRYLMYL